MKSRRAKVIAIYNDRDISDYIIDFSYTDNTDKTDDISLQLDDREGLWISDWFPETGDKIKITIALYDWNGFGDNRNLPIGEFEVDNVEFSDIISINAVSVPITTSARSESKSKGWEKINLSYIASGIALNTGLSLVYETDINPFYDRVDQNNKSDLAFLEELCKSDGLCMKVSDNQLIVFEESKYDMLPAVMTVTKGESSFYGYPKFSRNAKNIYKACEISFFDPKTDKTYKGYFEAENLGHVGHVLRLSEDYNSETDDINMDRKAKARLREQNKNEWKLSFSIKGDIIYFAGINIEVKGFKKFDGKYNVESVSHSIGNSGYVVSISSRRCLEGY